MLHTRSIKFRHTCAPCDTCGSLGTVDCPACDGNEPSCAATVVCPTCDGESEPCTCRERWEREADRRYDAAMEN